MPRRHPCFGLLLNRTTLAEVEHDRRLPQVGELGSIRRLAALRSSAEKAFFWRGEFGEWKQPESNATFAAGEKFWKWALLGSNQ